MGHFIGNKLRMLEPDELIYYIFCVHVLYILSCVHVLLNLTQMLILYIWWSIVISIMGAHSYKYSMNVILYVSNCNAIFVV